MSDKLWAAPGRIRTGNRPPTKGGCSTVKLQGQIPAVWAAGMHLERVVLCGRPMKSAMVSQAGFEPATYRLKGGCSAAELQGHVPAKPAGEIEEGARRIARGAPGRIRTCGLPQRSLYCGRSTTELLGQVRPKPHLFAGSAKKIMKRVRQNAYGAADGIRTRVAGLGSRNATTASPRQMRPKRRWPHPAFLRRHK